jgi:hypothetical protein
VPEGHRFGGGAVGQGRQVHLLAEAQASHRHPQGGSGGGGEVSHGAGGRPRRRPEGWRW